MVNYSKLSQGAILISLPFILPMAPAPVKVAPVPPTVHSKPQSKPQSKPAPAVKMQAVTKPLNSNSKPVAIPIPVTVTESSDCTCEEASALYDKGEYAKAAVKYRRAGELRAKEYGARSPEVALMRYNEGRCFHELSKYQIALGLYNQALNMYKSSGVEKSREEVAWTYWAIGSSQTELKSYKQAVVAFNQAVAQYKVLGPSSEYRDCLESFADCYQQQGMKAKADSLLKLAKTMPKTA